MASCCATFLFITGTRSFENLEVSEHASYSIHEVWNGDRLIATKPSSNEHEDRMSMAELGATCAFHCNNLTVVSFHWLCLCGSRIPEVRPLDLPAALKFGSRSVSFRIIVFRATTYVSEVLSETWQDTSFCYYDSNN